MTSICTGGGPSHPRSGLADTIILDSALIAAALTPGLEWLEPFIAAASGITVLHLPDLCATDPPADPGLTAADVNNFFLFPGLGPGLDGQQKIIQLLERFLWYACCECVSGGTPSAPTPPTAPTGLPQINPPSVVTAPKVAPCAVGPTTSAAMTALPFRLYPAQLIPNGCTSILASMFINHSTGVTSGCTFVPVWYVDLARNYLVSTGTSYVLASGASLAVEIPVPVQARYLDFVAQTPTNGSSIDRANLQVDYYCGNHPGETVEPCCPPDQNILGLLMQIQSLTTLIQRQTAPFGYVPGTVHSALTGSGQLAVSDLIGAKILMTTIPAYSGQQAGDPTEYFDVGWFAWGTADGFQERQFLTHAPQLSFPAAPGAQTLLGYSWNPGVVVEITELLREP